MPGFVAPHPSRIGQRCIIANMDEPQVYKLPKGLPEGVLMKTVSQGESGHWIVEEPDPPHTRWSVFSILLLKRNSPAP